MAHHEIEVAFLQKVIFDAGHDQRGIAFADFRNDDADGEAALLAQRAGHEIWTIVQLASGGADALLRARGNGLGRRRPIDDQGDSRGREAEMLGQRLQAHGLSWALGTDNGSCTRLRTGHWS